MKGRSIYVAADGLTLESPSTDHLLVVHNNYGERMSLGHDEISVLIDLLISARQLAGGKNETTPIHE